MTSLDSPPANCGADAYRRALDRGIFLIQRCGGCERAVFHPRMICPHCGADRLSWFEPDGAGVVYSTTVVRASRSRRRLQRRAGRPEGRRAADEPRRGVPPEAVRIGMSVRARIASENGQGLLVFAPQQEAT